MYLWHCDCKYQSLVTWLNNYNSRYHLHRLNSYWYTIYKEFLYIISPVFLKASLFVSFIHFILYIYYLEKNKLQNARQHKDTIGKNVKPWKCVNPQNKMKSGVRGVSISCQNISCAIYQLCLFLICELHNHEKVIL